MRAPPLDRDGHPIYHMLDSLLSFKYVNYLEAKQLERVCPICNALAFVVERCPMCGQRMTDGGAIENYWGPYSPYMSMDSLQQFEPDTQCVHLLYCSNCHYDTRAAWEFVII